ncbi:ubiquinol-cytochrome C chaperone family protein [Escherichia coli]
MMHLKKMSDDELKEFAREIGVKKLDGLTPKALVSTFQFIFKAGGFKSYQLTLIMANAIFKSFNRKRIKFLPVILFLTRTMAVLTGPVGWAITAIWTLVDVGGTAYRVTIPAVIYVAVLRSKIANADSEELAAEITLD